MQFTRGIGAIVAVVLAVGLVAIGCGGDDDGDSISKADFIAEANEICAEGDAEIEAAAAEVFGDGEPNDEELAEFAGDVVAPAVEGQIGEIRALGAPQGDEDEVTRILDTAQRGVDEIREDPGSILDGTLDEAGQLIADYGVEECR